MDRRTALALNAINRAFYAERAEAFSAARGAPWPGWSRLLSAVEAHHPVGPPEVLDVGCGNGRFGQFLADQLPERRGAIGYLGIDASLPLLERASARRLPLRAVEFRLCDFVESPLGEALGPRRFSLAVFFGVLHHVPDAARRRDLLCEVRERLRPGGLLALTAWRFATFRRFRERVVPWLEFNRSAPEPIDLGELEPGDHLLPWGDPPDGVRYCHFADEEETRELLAQLPLELLATWTADGRESHLNHYYLLRRPPEGGRS